MSAKPSLAELLAKEQAEKQARLDGPPQVAREPVKKPEPKAAEEPAVPNKFKVAVGNRAGGASLADLLGKEQAAKDAVLTSGVGPKADFQPSVHLAPAKLKAARAEGAADAEPAAAQE